MGLKERTEGSVLFGAISFDPRPAEPEFPAESASLRRARRPARFAPSRYFRIARHGETWWLVTPEGRPFYSIGIAPPRFEKEARGRAYLAAARDLGFNSLAAWHDLAAYADLNEKLRAEGAEPIPQFYALQTRTNEQAGYDVVRDASGAPPGVPAAKAAARGGFNHALPDPYDPRKPEPTLCAGPMYEDFRAFSRELLRRYNRILLETIRREDPGRLVFTNRFMLSQIGSVIENLDLYADYDAVAVNLYPANLSFGLAPHEVAALRLIHERSGKPLLIGEWSVPARDSGLYDNPARLDWSWPQTVPTQRDRARQAARVEADFYNLPFLIGAHFFIWSDFDSRCDRPTAAFSRPRGNRGRSCKLRSRQSVEGSRGFSRLPDRMPSRS